MPGETPTGKKLASKNVNIVHQDEIWKDHVRHENISARQKWPETWGYLVHEYHKLNHLLEGRPMTGRTSALDRYKTKAIGGLTFPEIPQRQKGFPRTTSQDIGWKSTQKGPNNMVMAMVTAFGGKKRGKCTLIKKLKWPKDCF